LYGLIRKRNEFTLNRPPKYLNSNSSKRYVHFAWHTEINSYELNLLMLVRLPSASMNVLPSKQQTDITYMSVENFPSKFNCNNLTL